MTTRALFLTYLFFFFMYFFGFGWMGNVNAGLPYHWHKQFEPFDFSYYTYTLATVLLAHFVVFRKFYYARPRWKLFIAILVLLVFFILFRYLIEEILFPAMLGYGNYNPASSFRYYAIDNVYFGSTKIFIGFVLFLFDEMFRNQRRQLQLQEQTKLSEMNFLQAQMNPHFLFNSLNNIYSLALEKNAGTATAVLKLSDMMRYVTYQKDNKVALRDEMTYIDNMLAIQQLRHDHALNTNIQVTPEAIEAKLPPLLLVSLVENVLKHGDLSDPTIPLLIDISLHKRQLHMTVINKKKKSIVTETGGVGLKNLRRRLELLYRPDDYSFIIEEKENIFKSVLIIPV